MNVIVKAAQTVAVPQLTIEIDDTPSFTFTDNSQLKKVTVNIKASTSATGLKEFSFILWSGDAYTAAGDYTQQQIATAVTAYLNTIKVNS